MKRTTTRAAAALAAMALLAGAGCTDRYGRPDPAGNALLFGLGGAAVGGLGSQYMQDNYRPRLRGAGGGGIAYGGAAYRDGFIGYAPGNYGRCSYYGGCW